MFLGELSLTKCAAGGGALSQRWRARSRPEIDRCPEANARGRPLSKRGTSPVKSTLNEVCSLLDRSHSDLSHLCTVLCVRERVTI